MSNTILITGCSRGIGLELVKEFSELGWEVLATCREPEKADELQSLAEKDNNIHIFQLDVNDVEQITKNIPYKSNQIALQYADVEDWYAGVGKSDTLSNDEQKFV